MKKILAMCILALCFTAQPASASCGWGTGCSYAGVIHSISCGQSFGDCSSTPECGPGTTCCNQNWLYCYNEKGELTGTTMFSYCNFACQSGEDPGES
jgi:hypothetical protein